MAHANGCLLIAAFIGLAAGSWAVFLLAFTFPIAGSVAGGDIRPRPRGR